ncbi:MAG: DUF58 domain-containing protein [Gammaproteobacteria bacterium]
MLKKSLARLFQLVSNWRQKPRIYILPTPSGVSFGLLLILMLTASINYNLSLGYVAVFLLGGVFWVGMVHTRRNIARLRFLGAKADPVFAGNPAIFQIYLDERGGAPCFSVEIRLPSCSGPRAVIDVPANGTASASLVVEAPKRGWLHLMRIRCGTRFPLGLFYAWTNLDASPAKCLVYPHPHGRRRLPRVEQKSPQGQAGTRDGSDDFMGFRAYRPGDPPRHIAWKALAREQAVLVKRFVGDRAERVWLTWKSVEALHDDEARLSQLCLWVLEAEARHVSYGLSLSGKHIGVGVGPQQRRLCLESLACYGAG